MTALVVPPIPVGLCGTRGCVFTGGHRGPHTWEWSELRVKHRASFAVPHPLR